MNLQLVQVQSLKRLLIGLQVRLTEASRHAGCRAGEASATCWFGEKQEEKK